jgi:hypothetical protein
MRSHKKFGPNIPNKWTIRFVMTGFAGAARCSEMRLSSNFFFEKANEFIYYKRASTRSAWSRLL